MGKIKRKLRRILALRRSASRAHEARSEGVDHTDNEVGWDFYAGEWKDRLSGSFEHLGDEWTSEVHDSDYLELLESAVLSPYLGRVDTVLEIGPGGGRITSKLLDHCRERLIACDVSGKMLELVERRFADEPKVTTHKLTLGRGLAEAPKGSADAVCSFEVFVHIDPHDIWEYVHTMWDVMKTGAVALIHHANTASGQGFERFLADHPHCINRRKPWGAFSVMTPEIMRRMVEHRGFEIVTQIRAVAQEEERDCLTVFRRPA